jgi:tyrosine-protein kinase Etk/Wzc
MCAQASTIYRGTQAPKEEDSVNFREIIQKYAFHWPLFVLVLIITLSIAFVYYKIKKPGYEVMGTMLIQDDSKDQGKATTERTPLEDINLISPQKVVENEIQILKSVSLVTGVVNDLQLWVTYSRKSKLVKEENLYGKSPLYFKLIRQTGPLTGQKFEVVIKDRNTFLLRKSNGKFVQFNFTDQLINSFGRWQLQTTKDIDSYIGSTITVTIIEPSAAAGGFQGGLKVDLVDKEASTVAISTTDAIPQRGADFVNDLMKRYNQTDIEVKNNLTKSTLNFIDQRLKALAGELNSAEGNLTSFQTANGVNDIDRQSEVYLQGNMDNDKNLAQVNVQLEVVNEIENYVNSPGNTSVPTTLGITDQNLSTLIEKLSELQIERDRLLSTTPETNPVFDPLNQQIKATRIAILGNVKNIKSSLLAQKRGLSNLHSNFESSIRTVPRQQKDLIGLKRDQTIKDDLYTYLSKKRDEIALSYASQLANARTVDSAYVMPANAVKKFAPFGVAVALSFLLPIGIVFARTSIKNTITHTREITKETDIPVLSELSYEKSKDPIVVHDRGKFAIAEEFRTLRTKLHYLHGKTDKGRVTLITSSVSSEGKSFIATNLAVAIAASGRKTAILEMDLRKPRVSAIFGLNNEHLGLSNYLNGEVSETKIFQKSETYPNLDIFGSGDFYPNPSELLEQDRMETLFNWLRENYDDIIVDTPPVNIVTDAIIVSRLADVTLYSIRQGYTSKVLLPFIKSINTDQHFPKLNAIFNGIEKGRFGYSGYGYGYGDYVADKQTKKKYSNSMFRDFFKRF